MQTAMAARFGILRILFSLYFDRQSVFEGGIPFGQNPVLHPVPAGRPAQKADNPAYPAFGNCREPGGGGKNGEKFI